MRPAFTLMLGISVALHAGLAAGVALFSFHFQPTSPTESLKPSALVLIPSNTFPARRAALPIPQIPVVTQPSIHHEEMAKPGTVAVLAARPAAKASPLSPEAILCPAHAPRLDSTAGIVFLLDVSGSMYEPLAGSNRLALARETLAEHIRALPNGTPFAITIYGEIARTSGPLVAASDTTRDAAVRFINEEFNYGGGTNLPAALTSAQALHPGNFLLVTDGDLNIGTTDLLGRTAEILGTQGQMLSVIGISPRADTDAEVQLHALADQEGGQYVEETPDGVIDSPLTPAKAQTGGAVESKSPSANDERD